MEKLILDNQLILMQIQLDKSRIGVSYISDETKNILKEQILITKKALAKCSK